ncbi:unnamed protein product [Triticum turgidum subsp. durum]|uniref:Uncharacterized protein n=1 Tax=Triticum turgidum subsp. durum TaxID=4567 RepID=A0A9R1AZI0_TRITD|nr:unnamed protein product [Triticum turgidum subsp. durum]
MESDDHGRVARRHEMWFSAPVGVVHERVGDDGINAVHSGSCHGALWWPLWYSSVAGQVSLVTRQVQSAEQTLFSKREEEGDLGSCPRAVSGDAPMRSHSGVCDAVLRLLSGGHIAAPQIAQYCNPFLPLLIFCRKESGAFRLDVPLEFDLVSFQIILCSAT